MSPIACLLWRKLQRLDEDEVENGWADALEEEWDQRTNGSDMVRIQEMLALIDTGCTVLGLRCLWDFCIVFDTDGGRDFAA